MLSVSRRWRRDGRKIVLVPTMGTLHEGHLSLIKQGRRLADKLVVSIFVNPAQFGPREDFSRYPRTFSADRRNCLTAGVDVLFCPKTEAIYPTGFETWVNVDVLTSVLEGAARPAHFRGVCTIVLKLLNIIVPDIAVFGQKDFQQGVVIRRMVDDLNLAVKIVMGPTVRETDGLALSSRNIYLSETQRKAAGVLYQTLVWAKRQVASGKNRSAGLIEQMRRTIERKSDFQVEYIEFADPQTLKRQRIISPPTVILLAARLGRTRFIDNIVVK